MKTIRWQMVMENASPNLNPFHTSEDVARYLREAGHANRDRETFIVLLLNTKNRIIAEEVVSVGTLSGSLVHPREVFKAAVSGSAAGIIVAHNHPSGDPEPSREDREITTRLRECGKILGIPLVDHVIVTPTGESYSFQKEGDWI